MTARSRLATIATAAVVAICSACAATPDADTDGALRIAFLLPESKTARYESHDRPAFVDRVREVCPECTTLADNANQNASRQQSQAEAAITNGADVLVLDPVDSAAAAAIVQHADAAGVPVITYDRLVLNAPVAFHITFDNERVGALQADVLVDALGQDRHNGSIVMLNGSPIDDNAAQFRRGASFVLDVRDVAIGAEVDVPDWSPDQAQAAMEQALATLGREKVIGVYAANDGMAGGAIAAMKAAGLAPLPPVAGQDAELAAIRRILTGEQHMTVYKPVRMQATVAAELAVTMARTGEIPPGARTGWVNNGFADIPTLILNPHAVTRHSIESTVIADGFWSRDEVCSGLEAACAEVGITEGETTP